MQNIASRYFSPVPLGQGSRVLGTGALLAFCSMLTVAAHAQSPSPTGDFDFAGLATTSKAQVNAGVGSFMPVVFGVMITLTLIFLIWKKMKGGVKSS